VAHEQRPLALLLSVASGPIAQISVSGGDTSTFQAPSAAKERSYSNESFFVIFRPGKNGEYTVIGARLTGGRSANETITGRMSKSNGIQASIKATWVVALSGRYNPGDDTITLTKMGDSRMQELLERMEESRPGVTRVKTGAYSGMTDSPEMLWDVNISRATENTRTVTGSVEFNGVSHPISGT
jgi:hypothetical protein